jgi:hypothetical protein
MKKSNRLMSVAKILRDTIAQLNLAQELLLKVPSILVLRLLSQRHHQSLIQKVKLQSAANHSAQEWVACLDQ